MPPEQPDDMVGPLLGATVGAIGGAWLFARLVQCNRYDERCGWDAVDDALTFGWTLGAAAGAHVGNSRRGSLLWDVIATGLAGAAGRRLARHAEDGGMIYLFTIFSQIIVAASVERMTGAGEPPRDTVTLQPGSAR